MQRRERAQALNLDHQESVNKTLGYTPPNKEKIATQPDLAARYSCQVRSTIWPALQFCTTDQKYTATEASTSINTHFVGPGNALC